MIPISCLESSMDLAYPYHSLMPLPGSYFRSGYKGHVVVCCFAVGRCFQKGKLGNELLRCVIRFTVTISEKINNSNGSHIFYKAFQITEKLIYCNFKITGNIFKII